MSSAADKDSLAGTFAADATTDHLPYGRWEFGEVFGY